MSENSMAVTTMDAPSDREIERIKQAGAKAVAHRREMTKLHKQLEGLEWGKALSPATRAVFAEFFQVTRANPVAHVDVLGGKIYLNAEYWADKIRSDPYFVDYEQFDISPSVEAAIRERASRMHERADAFPKDSAEHRQWKSRAFALEDEAEDIAIRRARWSPRETAEVVIETVIKRFLNAAPIEKIRSGDIGGDRLGDYIVEVREANWAGGFGEMKVPKKGGGTYSTYDPIGDANPGTTARTRSLRRCANKAFSAWMQQYEAQIHKAEEYLEAEYEVISTTQHPAEGQRLHIGTEDEGGEIVQDAETVEDLPTEEPFDRADAHKRYFATLKDAGIPEKNRKRWQKEHGLPESSTEFTRDDYDRAQEILVGPVREWVIGYAGRNLEDLSLRILQKSTPEYLRDWNALRATLEAQGAGDDEAETQAPLQL